MKRFSGLAMGAAMLAGAGHIGASAWAQATEPAPPPAAIAPATPAATAPAPATAPSPAPAAAATPTVAAAAQGGTIKGTVKASGFPLPGVSVTATNTLTGKKYATTTDIDGAFQMDVPRNGRYVLKTELTGFASTTQEVLINAASENGGLPMQTAEVKMDLASRVETPVATTAVANAATVGTAGTGGTRTATGARTGAAVAGGTTTATVARTGRGTQALNVQSSDQTDLTDATAGNVNSGVEQPAMGGLAGGDDASAASAATDSIAVTGNQGQINGLAGFSEDDLRNRIQGMQQNGFNNGDIASALGGVMQSGTFGGPGGGPGGGGFGGGPGGGPGGGGPGGGGGGGFGGGGGRGGGGGFGGPGGGFRGQNPNAWHGRVSYTGSDNALNADSYSVTGTPIPKPSGNRNTLTASVTGTPYIPRIVAANPKQFVFLSLTATKNNSPSILQAIVPTQAERLGDLTPGVYQAQQVVAGTQYFDPSTGQQYGATNCLPALYALDPNPTQCIPQSELSAAGQALLNYYPLPNIAPTQTGDNYQTNIAGTSDSSQISGRYNRSFGSAPVRGQRGAGGGGGGQRGQNRNAPPTLRQSIAENFAYQHSATANESFSPLLGGKSLTDGYSLSSSYTLGYGRLNNSLTGSWNRSRSTASNYFTNGAPFTVGGVTYINTNPATQAGVFVGNPTIYSNPFYYGVPSVGLTGLRGLSDATPSNTVNQTISLSEGLRWTHKRNNMQFGVDFRRIHADSIGGTNVLGSFTFSGYSTENPAAQTCVPSSTQTCTFTASGSPVADLLLGLPQQTGITAGLNKIYLRGNSWDWFATDDWRARSNLTFEYGVRWEYFSPYSEKYNRLVNLNLTGSGAALAIENVCATSATGCATLGSSFGLPPSLVNPDKALYSPRISVAYTPKFKWTKNMVIRSGYGINYNTGAYAGFAKKLAFQQPFAITQTNTLTTPTSPTTCTPSNMSLNVKYQSTTGFNCSTQTTQSNYGVDPNYKLGMVQVYNLGIQRTLPQGIVLNIDYTGAYAGNLDMLRAPNRNALGVLNSSSGQFTYEDSLGYQRSNALLVNLRQRMHKGISLQGTYTYSHSIDDASSVGSAGSGSIAQNDQNLSAEESNSTFDRRHVLNGNFVIEPPFGPNRAFLNKGGVLAKILDGYSISGNFTFASGTFATPQFGGTPAEIEAGAGGSLRPNRVPGTSIIGPQNHTQWFNTAAFTAPAAGTYGNASRNSIEMPGTVSISGSLSRTISFGETRGLEMRLNANNALNTVQYSGVDTQVNDSTFGQVTSATAMRSFTYMLMYRF